MMKDLLLLILTLIAGCTVSSDDLKVKGCNNGWVDFNLSYPDTSQSHRAIQLKFNGKVIRDDPDDWVTKGKYSLYHDTTTKIFRVIIKQIEKFGDYECTFFPLQQRDNNTIKKVEVEVKKAPPSLCQSGIIQTVSRTDKINITCEYPKLDKPFSKFICREKTGEKKSRENREEERPFICEDIPSTESPLQSNGYTLIETKKGFNVSISNVSPEHQGIYWCGVKSEDEDEGGSYRAGVKKIHLRVEGVSLSPMILSVVACVVVLVLLLVGIFVYSRFKHSKNRANGEQTEERAYEEIQERPQQPDSGIALKSVYATANLPMMPSDTPYYSTITPTNGAGKVNADTYQSPAYSTVNHPHRSPDDPFYSTLSCPQQQ
ncbi:uncharacterized protein LOC121505130 isoform X4 [Cheilinus undulatus]|uniref:uncharacterized protein LOC121505130 isoform X4 n=1 Tax=Cheilinus undulatus TaxID=241271 RepID=UPI001BD4CF98|nr:uncharacterized protein LOC121505130 isoform X4 [Cheilinus undulatus]